MRTMTTSEKVAYLKGLMEGMKLDTETNEGKLLSVIADILGDMAEDMEDMASDLFDLGEDVDAISDDLSDVEDFLCGEDWDDEEDEDWDEEDEEDDDDDEGEPMFFEVTCPSCEQTITVDEDVLNLGSIQCPNCGEMMEFEFDEEEDEPED
jgi:ribosomal protein S27E